MVDASLTTRASSYSTMQPKHPLSDMHTPNTSPSDTPNDKPFRCHYVDCLRPFQRKTSLTNHLKAHKNVNSRSINRSRRARKRLEQRRRAAAASEMAASSLPLRHHVRDVSAIAVAVPHNVTTSDASTNHVEANIARPSVVFHDDIQKTWPSAHEVPLEERLMQTPLQLMPAAENGGATAECEPFTYSSHAMALGSTGADFEGSLGDNPWDSEAFGGLLQLPSILPVPFEAAEQGAEQGEFTLQFPLGSVYGRDDSGEGSVGGAVQGMGNDGLGREAGGEDASNEEGVGEGASCWPQQLVFFKEEE